MDKLLLGFDVDVISVRGALLSGLYLLTEEVHIRSIAAWTMAC